MVGRRNIDRIIIVGILTISVWLVLMGRLFAVQVVEFDSYRRRADNQHQKKLTIKAPRGNIYDRHGIPLAKNTTALDFWTEKDAIVDLERVDSTFSAVLGLEPGFITRRVMNSQSNWLYLVRNVEFSKAKSLKVLEADSVFSFEVHDRVYPLGSYASQIVGFVDPDGRGLEGIELYYNRQLRGVDGEVIVLSDASGRAYRLFQFGGKLPEPGKNVHLTVDSRFQQIVESVLAGCIVDSCGAESGMAVFIRPSTGEILAMACYPSFDPNDYANSEPENRKMRTITDVFEPGSIFKIVAFSALLENDQVSLDEMVDCENGRWFFCDDTIHDAKPHKKLSASGVLIHSSNIGIIKLSQRLSNDELYAYATAFGFGSPTGIDLPGEVNGILRKPHRWSGMTPAAFPMGHEVAVTTLQMAAAYCAVANGGVLVQPHLIRKITDESGRTLHEFEPVRVRRVISEECAETLCTLLQAVVDSGTGVHARIEGLAVAGKTGTAQKVRGGGGGYFNDRFMSSFVGLVPSYSPEVVGIVVVNNPTRGPYWGGWTAAPIWRKIVSKAYAMGVLDLESPRDEEHQDMKDYVLVPDVRRMRSSQAREVLEHRGLKTEEIGENNSEDTSSQNCLLVVNQSPQAGRMVPEESTVRIVLKPANPERGNKVEIPDVMGLPLRDAAVEFAQSNVQFMTIGSGVVICQDPPAGCLIDRNDICLLTCEINKSH